MSIRNTFIIFLVSGFWHGANWTFIVWGGLNALFIMPSIIFRTNRSNLDIVAKGRLFPNWRELVQIATTFALTVFAWIFFRAASLDHAFSYVGGVFSHVGDEYISLQSNEVRGVFICFLLIIPFVIIEWLGRERNYAIEKIGFVWPRVIRWSFYSIMLFVILMYMQTGGTEFIYFQF